MRAYRLRVLNGACLPVTLMGMRVIRFGIGRFFVRALSQEQSLKVAVIELVRDWPTDAGDGGQFDVLGDHALGYF